MKRSDIEIMAPAGSWESLLAAIKGGADSVYFGVEKLNMRARSSHNFTTADLPEIAAICRKNGLKSYLTLNIVVFDDEIKEMKEVLAAAAAAYFCPDRWVASFFAQSRRPIALAQSAALPALF